MYRANFSIYIGNNLYTCESNVVKKYVLSSGTKTVVAGDAINGYQGYVCDNCAATSAWMVAPKGVTIDSSGVLYIADSGNFLIRKVVFDSPTSAPTNIPTATPSTATPTNSPRYHFVLNSISIFIIIISICIVFYHQAHQLICLLIQLSVQRCSV